MAYWNYTLNTLLNEGLGNVFISISINDRDNEEIRDYMDAYDISENTYSLSYLTSILNGDARANAMCVKFIRKEAVDEIARRFQEEMGTVEMSLPFLEAADRYFDQIVDTLKQKGAIVIMD